MGVAVPETAPGVGALLPAAETGPPVAGAVLGGGPRDKGVAVPETTPGVGALLAEAPLASGDAVPEAPGVGAPCMDPCPPVPGTGVAVPDAAGVGKPDTDPAPGAGVTVPEAAGVGAPGVAVPLLGGGPRLDGRL